jgi:hypothetical protein
MQLLVLKSALKKTDPIGPLLPLVGLLVVERAVQCLEYECFTGPSTLDQVSNGETSDEVGISG